MTHDTIRTMTPGLRTGDKLGPFEIQQQLASGGMAIVWTAFDRLLNRHVAIKQIADRQSVDEIFRDRFRREADLHKQLSHSSPNIVNVIDFVDDPRGLFIVMEFVDGLSLDRALAQLQAPVDPLRGLTVIRDVAQALAVIHAAGVIHRDLKPGNILLPAGGGAARICDFGIAALLTDQDVLNVGTPQYMAPELFGSAPVDGRADIYSLGMIAYEMLAGPAAYQQAFKAIVRDERNQPMRWMKWHTNQRIAAPLLHTVNPQVPQVFGELVERMMAKDPSQRIASASQLLEAIKRHFSKTAPAPAPAPGMGSAAGSSTIIPAARPAAAGLPGMAIPGVDSAAAPATAPLPKRGKLLYVLAGLVLLQALGVGGYFWLENNKKKQAIESVRNDAEGQFAEARRLFEAGRHADAAPMFAALAEAWGDDVRLGLGARGYQHLCQAHLFVEQASKHMVDDDYAASSEVYRSAAANIEKASDLPFPPNQGSVLIGHLDKLGREIASRRSFVQQAIEIDQAIRKGDFDAARRLYKQVRDVSSGNAAVLTATEQAELAELGVRLEDQQSRSRITEIEARAARLIADGQYIEARTELNKAIERLGADPRLTSRLAQLTRQQDLEAALRQATEAEASGDLATAVAAYARANDIDNVPARGEKIRQLRSTMSFNEGQKLEASGADAAAAGKYQEAISFWPNDQAQARLVAMKNVNEKSAILKSADTAYAAGDYDRAGALYQKALDMSPDPQTQQRINQAAVRLHVQRAEGHLRQGKLDPARDELSQALAIDANDSQASSLLSSLETRARYLALIDQAEKLRTESQFAASKATYQKAIDLAKAAGFDSRDIAQRKQDTEFDHLIAQAKSAMDFSLWVQARAYLMTARNMKPDDQRVATLLEEVEANVAKQPKQP
jgi:serine/threonine-protein kinase